MRTANRPARDSIRLPAEFRRESEVGSPYAATRARFTSARDHSLVVGIVAAALFAGACAALFRFTAEDAYIVQRYAKQLVRGYGLIFNIGERVSALTSPLHTLVLGAFTWLLPWPMTAYKVFGAAVAGGAILFAGRRLFADAAERALFLSATLASPFVAMWAIGGLETPLLLACVTVLTVLALELDRDAPSRARLAQFFLLAAVAFLLRHDSIVFVGPLAVGILWKHREKTVPGLIAAILLAAAWLLFAWRYYGDPLPTSFYLKAVETRPGLLGGYAYQLSFVVLCLLPVFVVRWPVRPNIPRIAWVSVVLLSLLGASVGHVHMMFGFRLYVPFIPALVALALRATQPMPLLRRWGFAGPLSANVVLFAVVHSFTVNPNLFHPSVFAPHYGFLSRMAQRGVVYEYTNLGAAEYGDFIDALQQTGRAVAADAEARGIARSARLATIIGGATPNEIPDIYVYDNLVGVRRNCPTLLRAETYRAADYLELMVPRFGPLERQLGDLAATATRVSDVEFEFDGRKEHIVIYFNPVATHTPVPAMLHDPCPPGRR